MWKRESDQNEQADRAERAEVRSMAQEGEVTIVGQGARLEGTIVSAGSLRIDGQVKGQINADGDVMLSPQSQVEADIRADNVVVAGRFKGNIVVKGKTELARGGRIDGNITSKTLVVQEGGMFSGQSNMDQGSTASQPGSQASHGKPAAASARPATGPNGSESKSETESARAATR
jgi:cytoskeletal protein CcmA (bactofilin family)